MPALGEPAPGSWHPAYHAFHSNQPVSYRPAWLGQSDAGYTPGSASRQQSGRRCEEMRPCCFQLGAIPNAAGSAYIEQGSTKVLASVYGPRQRLDRDKGAVVLDLQFSSFACRNVAKEENDRRVELYKALVMGAIESTVLMDRYFKLTIDLNIVILQDNGSALASALSVASLALADASVEMRDIMAGVSIQRAVQPTGPAELLLDCDAMEERSMRHGSSVLHLGFCPSRGKVCMMHAAGSLADEPFEEMVHLAKEAAVEIGTQMNRCLEERVERRRKRQKIQEAVQPAPA
eukprot:CAMPEP_0178392840 /NCGR_PEP_ID=MMETSP0689_2-20121128/11884_1 /TAXON_ID=160604 /ORGANISM="Amphidinium massartii, Strain CS-259" /LENGTH=289 /DNA_ID=CAMNT_0020013423 /DNA_START=15 /DNA_END=881 /DNA_ORIENTATION=-